MTSRNENNQADQTHFVDQVHFVENKSGRFFDWRDLKNNKNLLPFYILIGLFFLIVFLIILRLIFRVDPEPEKKFQAEEEIIEIGPLNKRVYDLREELKEHNPTKQRLPFPQVDLEFNIN